jgi:hypothetical protein
MPDRRAVFPELARYGESPTRVENIELAGKIISQILGRYWAKFNAFRIYISFSIQNDTVKNVFNECDACRGLALSGVV